MNILQKLGEAIDKKKIRPRVEVYLYDDKGRVLASRGQEGHSNNVANSWKFPGGGIESKAGINDTAKREALEEAGFETSGKMHAIDTRPNLTKWPDFFRKDMKKQKNRDFHAQYTYFRAAPIGSKNDSELGADKDTLKGMEMVPLKTLIKDVESAAKNPDNKYQVFDNERLKGLRALESRLKNIGVVKEAAESIKLEEIPLISPPPSGSKECMSDLRKTLYMVRNPEVPDSLYRLADSDISELFRELLKEHKKPIDSELMEQAISFAAPVIIKLKEYFSRPRPEILGKRNGILIPNKSSNSIVDSSTGKLTYSYPSGHATQAKLVSLVLSDKFPDISDKLQSLADLIATSRVEAGLHTKADIDYGKIVAETLHNLIGTKL